MITIPLIDESRLVTLSNDPAIVSRRWRDRAACAEPPLADDTYFPEEGERPPVDALARCHTCPVADQCLATALVHEAVDGLRFGWWGGYSPQQREDLADRLGIETQPIAIDVGQPADLARHLRTHQYTIRSIAAELGCTERTVYRYLAASAA